MNTSKKVLGMLFCCFIVLGSNQVNLVNAHAAEWKQQIKLKLRAKWNFLYKDWWTMNLHYKNGNLTLEGPTNIPENLTFDDVFVFGYKRYGAYDQVFDDHVAVFRGLLGSEAGYALERAKCNFNKKHIKNSDAIFMNGEYWDDTLTFPYPNHKIIQTSDNNYSLGFISVNKFTTAFRVGDNGLTEQYLSHYTYY